MLTPGATARHLREDLGKLVRVTRDFPPFVRTPFGPREAARTLADRLATRAERFLWLAERAVYGNPASPYRTLLGAAGCELGDLRALVERDGLEGALTALLGAGVYLTFDEFKGRREVVRGSLRFACAEAAFDNPLIAPHIEAWSGGTRSPGTSVKLALPYFADLAVNTALAFEAHRLGEHAHAVWLQGFTPGYIYAKLGRPVLAWFYPVDALSARHRAVSTYIALLGRFGSHPLPAPRFVDVAQPERVADWLGAQGSAGRRVCLTTYASSAVRIAGAAQSRGLSLGGVCFITLGEPFTDAKRQAVEASGARALVRYAFTEAGIIGYGCAVPSASDDLHFCSDSYALVERQRTVGDGGPMVAAFVFTSLLSSAPKILLNVESGDTGLVEERACACPLNAAGLRRHLSGIRSFEKLSGEGMTFIQTDLLRVLEEVLPARFGGTSADYQVLETEGERGILRLLLLVSPAVGSVDADAVRRTFLAELGGGAVFDRFSATVWERAGTVEVRRQRPLATRAGKILPFHVAQAGALVRNGP
jgi:hypothetical protein